MRIFSKIYFMEQQNYVNGYETTFSEATFQNPTLMNYAPQPGMTSSKISSAYFQFLWGKT
jgi:hypothetical protein